MTNEERMRRESNLIATIRTKLACRFYKRNGMTVAGTVAWSGGTIAGLVYKLNRK